METLYSLDEKASKYMGNVLKWCGFSPDFVEWCDENEGGLSRRLGLALSIYKKTFPNREYTIEDIVLYGMIIHAVGAATSNFDWMSENMRILVRGKEATDFYDHFPELFKPQDIEPKEKKSSPKMHFGG